MSDTLDKYLVIYDLVRLIPFGRVSSYGTIARFAGPGITARLVGRALTASQQLANVPAHRVVNSEGKLTGKMHFGSPTRMAELLEAEGIKVVNDKVVAFKEHFWSPEELSAEG